MENQIATARSNQESLCRLGGRLGRSPFTVVREQVRKATREFHGFPGTEPFAGLCNRVPKPTFMKRLYQIIEGVFLKSTNSKCVKCRDKYYQRYVLGLDTPQNCKTVQFWHLHVQKQQVWRNIPK